MGWLYSAFVFLGVNLLLLVMIAMLYTALLISIWRTRSATPLTLLDCEFAVRFFHRADRLPVLGAHHRYEDLGFFQLQYLR